ncbi:hypothetical protein l13_11870 [Neisseria weaveri ATCC 51223]|nr:hypothetical protein l13_11870 [Neisseria weaveri ATCC 51223]
MEKRGIAMVMQTNGLGLRLLLLYRQTVLFVIYRDCATMFYLFKTEAV